MQVEVLSARTYTPVGSYFDLRITCPKDRPVALVTFSGREALTMQHLPAGYVYEFSWWGDTRHAWWYKRPGEGPRYRVPTPVPRDYKLPPDAQWLDCVPKGR